MQYQVAELGILEAGDDEIEVGSRDEAATARGNRPAHDRFGPGLAEYREWVYRQLESPADVSVKKKTYFTPAEIVAIDAARLERPQLMTKWLAHPPASLAEIEADVLSAR